MAGSRAAAKFGSHLKELRLHLCQKSAESAGVREFVMKHYRSVKNTNPTLPILIRECSGVQPKVYARYAFGKESHASLSGLSADQVMTTIEQMAQKTV
ncbi:NADH dehydrogenase [ubiquinone] 1 alpha subcomplex subunit 2 [Dermacentor albipictus]|uniref:NADH dehydrogenase [ubiquinone] 1 alpha subcomplex subunit 2 n=1 Tax=Dermacentor albipictus TaxID=60249 RepID=UPI0031FD969C